MGSTAGDLCWEKQISLKLVGEVDLSHSFSRPALPSTTPTKFPLLSPPVSLSPPSCSLPPTVRAQLRERQIKPRRSVCLKSTHTIVAFIKSDYHTAGDSSDKEELASLLFPLMSGVLFASIPLNSKSHYPAPLTI